MVVEPVGVWSSAGEMQLSLDVSNSGMGSVLPERPGQESVAVRVVTIDRLAEDLKLPRVDYIKMDIEGAEREALAGASDVLRRNRPRLMLDMYHRPDDTEVLPRVIRQANPGYLSKCGPCASTGAGITPQVVFFY